MLKLLILVVALATLFVTNPPLADFTGTLQKQIDESRSVMRASAGFVRDVTGMTRLKQATGVSSHYACRLDLYVGSLFLLRHKSAAGSSEPRALGIGAAGQVYVRRFENEADGGELKQIAASLGEMQCEAFLVN